MLTLREQRTPERTSNATSSRAFNPTTGSGACPLCGIAFAPGMGDAFFKTMQGTLRMGERFNPALHVEFEAGVALNADGSPKLDRDGNPEKERRNGRIVYRNVLTGEALPIRQVVDRYEEYTFWNRRTRRRETGRKAIFRWEQSFDGGSSWTTVASFDHMVHVSCAAAHGFSGPNGQTVAQRGTRYVGHGHRVETAPPVVRVEATAPVAPVTPPAPPAPPVTPPAPPAPPADDLSDVQHIVERFKRLDLD